MPLPTSELVLWDLPTGQEVRRWNTDVAMWLHPLQISPDGKYLVCQAHANMGQQRALLLYDVTVGKLVQQWPADGLRLPVVHFTPDSKRLIAASPAAWKVWDVATGDLLFAKKIPNTVEGEMRRDGPQAVAAISHDCTRLVTTSSATNYGDSRVLLWDIATGQQLLNRPVPDENHSINFSRDDQHLIFVGYADGIYRLRVWDGTPRKQK